MIVLVSAQVVAEVVAEVIGKNVLLGAVHLHLVQTVEHILIIMIPPLPPQYIWLLFRKL